MTLGIQRSWWMKEDVPSPLAQKRFRGIAYYRHSARDRQENSVVIQQELVQKWAGENGVDIIHEFADRGKSGLTAEGRDAFNDMMENWVNKRNDFEFVLCLDVSRWGRFQDIDLSATYSAECKKHGKQVIYTTLGMPRPDDPLYPVYVQFERFRAAQFSKELSAKVSYGCIKVAQQGYWVGGSPPYGYSRLLLDELRKPLHVLEPHQKKGIQNQRVTLTPGPEDQVATIRRIFHEFVDLGRDTQQIASGLNQDGVHTAKGRLWEAGKIRGILTNIMYAGTLVYNKTTKKLKTRSRKNPVDIWVRTAGAFDGLVESQTFERAQEIIKESSQRYSRVALLDHLTRLYREHGFIRASILRADASAPSASTYTAQFSSLDAAYQQLFRTTVDEVRGEVETRLRKEVEAIEAYEDFLVINRKFTVLVQPSVPVPHGYSQYWYFRPDSRVAVDITLGVPVSGSKGPTILGYLALPRLLVQDRAIRLFGSQQARLDMYGHTGLDVIVELARS